MPTAANGNLDWNERLEFLVGRLAAARSDASELKCVTREAAALTAALDSSLAMLEAGLASARCGFERARAAADSAERGSAGRD